MILKPSDLWELPQGLPREVSLVALASFKAEFDPKAEVARAVGTSVSMSSGHAMLIDLDSGANLKITQRSGAGTVYSFGLRNNKNEFCDLDNVISSKEVFAELQAKGIDDVVLQSTVTLKPINDLPQEVTEVLEYHGIERLASFENIRGVSSIMAGIQCKRPSNLIRGAIESVDPHHEYEIGRLSRRLRGVQVLDTIIVDDGKKIVPWSEIYNTGIHNSLMTEWTDRIFWKDVIRPRGVVVAENGPVGEIYVLKKYGGYLGCRCR